MDGQAAQLRSRQRRRRAGAAGCLATLLAGGGAGAEILTVHGSCREGAAHGEWRITAPDGQVRGLGAFAKGRRTGSFIFWDAAGVRIAHIPYEDDVKSGTLALWYAKPARGGEAPQKLEAAFSGGLSHGPRRSFHPDGRLRGEYVYRHGELAEARAWNAKGVALAPDQARAQADADQAADAAYFASLESLVNANLPRCPAAARQKPR